MCALESLDILVVFQAPTLVTRLVIPGLMFLSIRGNGVDSCFLRYSSTKSTLVPGCFSALSATVFS